MDGFANLIGCEIFETLIGREIFDTLIGREIFETLIVVCEYFGTLMVYGLAASAVPDSTSAAMLRVTIATDRLITVPD